MLFWFTSDSLFYTKTLYNLLSDKIYGLNKVRKSRLGYNLTYSVKVSLFVYTSLSIR